MHTDPPFRHLGLCDRVGLPRGLGAVRGRLVAAAHRLGLAYTNWTCEHWYMEFGWGDSDPDYSGRIDLYHQPEDGQEYAYSYSGIWRMEGDCLHLDLSDGAGTRMSGSFPVLIDPSGESLHIQQDRETGVCPPFFGEGMTCMDLIRAYG